MTYEVKTLCRVCGEPATKHAVINVGAVCDNIVCAHITRTEIAATLLLAWSYWLSAALEDE